LDVNVFQRPVVSGRENLCAASTVIDDKLLLEKLFETDTCCHTCGLEYIEEDGSFAEPDLMPIVRHPCGHHVSHFECLVKAVDTSMALEWNPHCGCPQCRQQMIEIPDTYRDWPELWERYPSYYHAAIHNTTRVNRMLLTTEWPAVDRDPTEMMNKIDNVCWEEELEEPYSLGSCGDMGPRLGPRGWAQDSPEPQIWVPLDRLYNPARSKDARTFLGALKVVLHSLHDAWNDADSIHDVGEVIFDSVEAALSKGMGPPPDGKAKWYLAKIVSEDLFAWITMRVEYAQKLYMPVNNAELHEQYAKFKAERKKRGERVKLDSTAWYVWNGEDHLFERFYGVLCLRRTLSSTNTNVAVEPIESPSMYGKGIGQLTGEASVLL
jgi:hypothetical protein